MISAIRELRDRFQSRQEVKNIFKDIVRRTKGRKPDKSWEKQ
jgi:hypothetical protein